MDKQSSTTAEKKGFTLVEVLVVLAMVLILFAAVTPNVVRAYQTMRLLELDDTAREVFLTAQSELTGMKTAGVLERYARSLEGNTVPLAGKDTVYVLSDFTSLPQTALLLRDGGSYVAELNLATGDVCAVYLSKTPGLTLETVQAMLAALPEPSRVNHRRNNTLRGKAGIGYYGGVDAYSAQLAQPAAGDLAAELAVCNGEDLYAELVVSGITQAGELELSITVTGESGAACTWTAAEFSAAGNRACLDQSQSGAGIYRYTLLLDSMTVNGDGTDNRFATIAAEKGSAIRAGEILSVTAQVKSRGTPVPVTEKTALSGVSSLFEKQYTAADAAVLSGTRTAGDVDFSCVRHLSNLEKLSAAGCTAVQTGAIDFEARAEGLMPGNRAALPAAYAPVGLTQGSTRVNGNFFLLKNFLLQQTDCTGVFRWAEAGDTTLENLRIVDLGVEDSGSGARLGALAGRIKNTATISNCGVYRTAAGVSRLTARGGTPVGGLVGLIQNGTVTVENSFAAVDVDQTGAAASQTGGLIGSVEGGSVTLRDCYTSCAVRTAQGQAGGFIGSVSGEASVSLEGCYTTSDVAGGTGDAGAWVGQISLPAQVQVKSSTAYNRVSWERNGQTTVTYGPMIGRGSAGFEDCAYLYQSDLEDADTPDTRPGGLTPCRYSELTRRTTGVNQAKQSFPYSPGLGQQSFPFPTVTENRMHYGDWPVGLPEDLALVRLAYLAYYEQYSDGTWGVFTVNEEGGPVDLLKNTTEIRSSGYVLLLSPEENRKGVTVNGLSGQSVTSGTLFTIAYQGSQYYAYQLNNKKVPLLPLSGGSSRQVTILQTKDGTAQNFYVNGNFAGISIHSSYGTQAGDPFQIRTPEQLNQLRTGEGGWYFRQTRDVAATAEFQTAAAGVYGYDGGGRQITGLPVTMFRQLEPGSRVSGLILKDVQLTASGDTAALAVRNDGEIWDCAVDGGSVTADTQSADGGALTAAGLVSENTGEIRRCAVKNCTVTASGPRSRTIWAAGLAAKNSGTIRQSYTDHVTVNSRVTDPLSGGYAESYAGGFLINNESGGRVERCYVSGGSVQSDGFSAGFVYRNKTNWAVAHCYVKDTALLGLDAPDRAGFGFTAVDITGSTGALWEPWPVKTHTPPFAFVQGCYTTAAGNLSQTGTGNNSMGDGWKGDWDGTCYGTVAEQIDWSAAVDSDGYPLTEGWPMRIVTLPAN